MTKSNTYLKNTIIALPFCLLTIVPFLLLAHQLDVSIKPGYIALGALGWWAALMLRMPVILLLTKSKSKFTREITVGISGPAEELVRLILLLILGLTTQNALSVGIGWALIEIIYSAIQGVAIGVLKSKNDAKSKQALKLIAQKDMNKALVPTAPFWGIIERFSANALHMSFALLLVVSPWLVFITMPIHSACNYLIMKVMKSSLARAEATFFTASLVVMLFSVALIIQRTA